jgi:redox-sensitive bicupin YhaK (pirin superfamily)
MFSGDWIEHQELNLWDEPARVIQIWFIADRQHRGLLPHYQQIGRARLPTRQAEGATVYSLIGADSPMEQHMTGRLTATVVPSNGATSLEAPQPDEDLFLYVTDGAGTAIREGQTISLGQYDVILATPDMDHAAITGAAQGLDFLSFYLPRFLT